MVGSFIRSLRRRGSSAAGFGVLIAACATAASGVVVAQPAATAAGIYSCTDAGGRRLTADRPIAECMAQEQRVLNRDGSVRAVQPPALTPEERARKETRERAAAQAVAAQREAARRDRHLMLRYADEDAHQRARENALDTVRLAIKATDTRLRALAAERKPLVDEVEFYKGGALPAKLRAALDANDAAREAQRASAQNQERELDRINRLYDAELDRLRRLWAGAVPGTTGTLAEGPGGRANAR